MGVVTVMSGRFEGFYIVRHVRCRCDIVCRVC